QVEQTSTRHKATQYKPKNISELCAFVAAVRPGFKSMYNIFEKREPFSYDIPTFDNLIQTPEMPNSFLLYQEMAMSALNYAGIPMSDCYDVIKHIAKKRAKEVKKYKDQFMVGFKERLIEVENIDKESAQKATEKVWHIIDDSCDYSFNAAHAYSVAIDSLYGAYLKSHYPLQFYEVLLNVLDEKGTHKKRMAQVRKEAESAYGIRFVPMRFRQDNRKITANVEDNSIQNTLSVIKGFSDVVAEQLYELKDNQYDTFVDLLIDMEEKKILSKKIEDLIMIQYFDEFGQNGKLLKIYQEFTGGDNRYKRTHKDATKEKRIVALKEIEANLPNERISLVEQMAQENKLLGYIQVTFDVEKKYVYIAGVNTKFAPRLDCYCLANGKTESMKIQRPLFNDSPLNEGDIIYIYNWQAKPRLKYDKGKFVEIPGTKEWWITAYDRRNHEFQ
ncbi:MAG: hypothetical protein GX957_09560, partial [Clostridiaceae bacterium]|nr:hypothetical protein [Clostridiaceae bacterium]